MGVYIKGMEMPANCTLCACGNDETRYCKAANEYIPMIGKPRFCPLVEVAEPHGRLIDADALVNTVVFHTNIPADTKEFIEDLIGIAPTVIEAEEG